MRSCLFIPLLQQELLAEGKDKSTNHEDALCEGFFIPAEVAGHSCDDGEHAEHALHVDIGDALNCTNNNRLDKTEDNAKGKDNGVGTLMSTAGLSFALASALNDDGFHIIPLK